MLEALSHLARCLWVVDDESGKSHRESGQRQRKGGKGRVGGRGGEGRAHAGRAGMNGGRERDSSRATARHKYTTPPKPLSLVCPTRSKAQSFQPVFLSLFLPCSATRLMALSWILPTTTTSSL